MRFEKELMETQALYFYVNMRYFIEKPSIVTSMFGEVYTCNHPLYDKCTLYKIGNKGLAVVQQRFDANSKSTYWTEIDSWLNDILYLRPGFIIFFNKYAGEPNGGLYPTVTVRQIMWQLRLKPIKRERWETVIDRKLL